MSNKLAFIFPGQGSQTVGMLKELATQYPIIQQTFQEASQALDYDLWDLSLNGPAAALDQTERTQPALLAAGVALWRLWQSQQGEQPHYMAGHSLGEYTALVCAGALDFTTAIRLVALRGQLMQAAVQEGQGAMAAIVGLDQATIEEICAKAAEGNILSPANYNAIGQIVIAGEASAVDRGITLATAAGAKIAKKIAVSVPSHCALMRPAAERLARYLEDTVINSPRYPVINNVDVAICYEPAQIRAALVKQLYSPVRWVEIVQYLAKQEVTLAIECGPGKVLAGLNKRIDAQVVTSSIAMPEALQQALGAFQTVV